MRLEVGEHQRSISVNTPFLWTLLSKIEFDMGSSLIYTGSAVCKNSTYNIIEICLAEIRFFWNFEKRLTLSDRRSSGRETNRQKHFASGPASRQAIDHIHHS